MTMQAIDADPEFFHGLTVWGDGWASQICGGGESVTTVALHLSNQEDSTPPGSGVDQWLNADDARRLRDLLNLATARGFL